MDPRELLNRAGLPPEGRAEPLAGGDMGRVWRLGPYVVKTDPNPPRGLFPAEARGLDALAAAGVRVPRVHWVGEEGIVLEYLPAGADDWAALARMIAGLHTRPVTGYGTDRPVFLGRFELPVERSTDWREFWTRGRLQPLLDASRERLGELAGPLERFVRGFAWPAEGPVLVHGDLWSGNVLMAAEGPALIDPSAWHGERAVDLAMMRLLGGFPEAFWAAYEAVRPVPPEVREALPAYQLYFLLVHVHFFGSGYLAGVRRVLRHYGFL
ncbi:fructosamine kinase family protein [Deinococcota bacterium DY0809b]